MFFLRRTRVGTLSAWGARSARGRARREAEKRASGRGASLTSQAAPTIAPRAQNLSKSKTSFWLGSQTTSQNISTAIRVEPPLSLDYEETQYYDECSNDNEQYEDANDAESGHGDDVGQEEDDPG